MKDKIAKLGIFTATQTVYQIGTVLLMAVSVLAGQTIANQIEFASLPLSLVILGTLIGLFPASQWMQKFGRKNGLFLGSAFGVLGAFLSFEGLVSKNFAFFCIGHLFFGFHQSFLQYLRFVAMESVAKEERASALSWILVAGIPAAFLGPLAGFFGKNLFTDQLFAGSYLLLVVAITIQFVLIYFLPNPKPQQKQESIEIENFEFRPFSYHIKNPGLWLAVISSSFGFALMVMLMSAVPVAMKSHGHTMHDSTLVLQWHVLGMYIPSFFSGGLVKRFGSPLLILFGTIILMAEVFAALMGTGFLPFSVALVLLGIGWNFMFVGGTNLLVEQYNAIEKNTIQAINDSSVYLLATISTYGAGFLEVKIGWQNLNLVSLPFLVFVFLLSLVYQIRTQKKKSKDS
ncbi:MFS transporter [Leptospira sp. 96542]|nr:MFS transporter [Leptospira sp. 96542]